jgi:hypothetical protein
MLPVPKFVIFTAVIKREINFMNRILFFLLAALLSLCGCADTKNEKKQVVKQAQAIETAAVKDILDFIPKGYKIFEEITGDLNKDGRPDRVIIIKATNKDSIVDVENHGKLDRNRRGVIILFDKKNGYVLATKNYNCFSSENEDGGVYTPPDLWLYVKKGNLYIHYAHGRYGYWRYVFRYKQSDFELIGYDSSDDTGPIVNKETSINFLTKKILEKRNTNDEAEGGDEVFEETLDDIYVEDPMKLSQIQDFDEIDISECCYSMP